MWWFGIAIKRIFLTSAFQCCRITLDSFHTNLSVGHCLGYLMIHPTLNISPQTSASISLALNYLLSYILPDCFWCACLISGVRLKIRKTSYTWIFLLVPNAVQIFHSYLGYFLSAYTLLTDCKEKVLFSKLLQLWVSCIWKKWLQSNFLA